MNDGHVDEQCAGEGGPHGFQKLVFFEGGHPQRQQTHDYHDCDEKDDEYAFQDGQHCALLHLCLSIVINAKRFII